MVITSIIRAATRAVHGLAKAMHVVSGMFLVVMMAAVLSEIVTRTLFGMTGGTVDFTFRGGVEIVSYGLLLMILFALPYSVSRGQVIVDLFTDHFPERVKIAMSGVYTVGFAGLGVGMTVGFYGDVGQAINSGETTQDLLIPMQYIYAVTTFAAAVLAVRAMIVSVELLMESLKRT